MGLRITDKEQLAFCSPAIRAQLERELDAQARAEQHDGSADPVAEAPRGKGVREYPEEAAGRELVKWAAQFRFEHPALGSVLVGDYLVHNANGGARSRIEAAILIGQGVRPGFPDYTLYLPIARYHGLVLELKAPDGAKPTAEQLNILARIERAGYAAAVAWGGREAADAIRKYLGLAQ
jgi:hypothetical protein